MLHWVEKRPSPSVSDVGVELFWNAVHWDPRNGELAQTLESQESGVFVKFAEIATTVLHEDVESCHAARDVVEAYPSRVTVAAPDASKRDIS